MQLFDFYLLSFFLINLICGISTIYLLYLTKKKTESTITQFGIFFYMAVMLMGIILSFVMFIEMRDYAVFTFAIFLGILILFAVNIACSLFISQFFYTWRYVGDQATSDTLVGIQFTLLFLFSVFIFVAPIISLMLLIINIPWMIISEIVLEVLYIRNVNRLLHTIGYDMDQMLEAKELANSMIKAKVALGSIAIPGIMLVLSGNILNMGLGWVLLTLCCVVGTVVVDKKVQFMELLVQVKKESDSVELDAHVLSSSKFSIAEQ